MPMPCAVCNHPDKDAIERRIIAKQLTYESAGAIVGCTKQSISRHMTNHVGKAIAESMVKGVVLADAFNVAEQLIESHIDVRNVFKAAIEEGNKKLALRALEVELKQMELTAKISGQYSDGTQVNIMQAPEFVKLKQILVEKMLPFPEARTALSAALEAMAQEEDLLTDGDESDEPLS